MTSRFDEHFRMNEQDVIQYVKEKLDIFEGEAALECREIGDGNINYIFRVSDPGTGRSVIVKHADVTLRSNANSRLTTDRSRIEAEALRIEGDLAPGMVPELYLYDPVMCCLCMEDLSDHANMRYALVEHRTFPMFAEHMYGLPCQHACQNQRYSHESSGTKAAVAEVCESLVPDYGGPCLHRSLHKQNGAERCVSSNP